VDSGKRFSETTFFPEAAFFSEPPLGLAQRAAHRAGAENLHARAPTRLIRER
jgi:hypothetical protein